MRNSKSFWLLLAVTLGVAACSSGGSTPSPAPVPPPPAAGIALSGAVVDGPVAGATLSAYAVSSAGVVGTTALATATTSSTGSYTLTLPAGTTGAVLVKSTGGTFVDDVTGKTVSAPTLEALIPTIAAGATAVTAQLTPLTTIAAQVALDTSSATNPVGSAAAAINTAIGSALGGQSNIVGTPLVNVSTAGCAASASQASVDASLVLAGIAQLAAAYDVSTADLVQALIADIESDNVFDGTANGVVLTVPLSGGTVKLCTIEGNCAGATVTGLAHQLGAAVLAFQKSGANTCGSTESSTQQQAFAAAPDAPPPPTPTYKYEYLLNSTITGFSGPNAVQATMMIGLLCSDDGGGTTTSSPFHGFKLVSGSGGFTLLAGANGESSEDGYTVGINAQNDCGTNTWTLKLVIPSNLSCGITGKTSGTFTSSDGGFTNVANSPPTLSCSTLYSVGGNVTGLTAGSSVVLEDNGGDELIVPGSSAFTFATDLASGASYDVTVATQPSGFNCTVSPNSAQTIGSANVTNVAVNCSPSSVGTGGTPGSEAVYVIDSTYTLFEFDALGNLKASVKLPGSSSSIGNLNGGGITVDANNVYVALGSPSTGVAAFNRTTLEPVTLAAGAFSNLNTPRAIVFDPTNSQFYVANGGSTVTIYNATGAYLSSFYQNDTGIYGPSGIAYDSIDNTIWVANYTGGGSAVNPTYGIAEFTPSGNIVANFPTANTNPPIPFAPPVNTGHEMPYSISYCGSALAVGYISDSSGSGRSEGGGYSTSGTLLGTSFGGAMSTLHAMACAPGGTVFVATDNGLLEYADATGTGIALPAGGFAALKAPIYGVGVGPATGLNSPEGLVYSNGSLYVANGGSNQVLVYSIKTSTTTQAVTGMTLSSTIAADINGPSRLALDAAGHLFVANAGNNTVTAYDTTNGNAEITAAGAKPLISGGSLNQPLGVAVDSKGNVYVANNGGNSLSVYQPVTSGSVSAGYHEASFSPVSADAQGNAFPAPGVLLDVNILGQDYLLVGIGSTVAANHVFIYDAPFTGPPTLVYNLSSVTNGVACATMPTGPTGIALFLSQTQPLTSQIFVTSYYNNDVAEYLASQLIGSTSTCPTPITTGSQAQISGPEGVAVDTTGTNVFVSNAAANTITVYPAGSALGSSPPIFTQHN
jgi:DNA-binding beta-propeller fold protein YncE